MTGRLEGKTALITGSTSGIGRAIAVMFASEGAHVVVSGRDAVRGQGRASYKWIVLSNTTLGILMATINSSILLISLPAIFRGIHLNPLAPGNSSYLLWILLGYLVVTAVLLVTFGRLSDMVGHVKMYNLGFAVFTLGSILLSVAPGSGSQAALELLLFRLVQGVGGAFLFANGTALITDAFPPDQRGLALGINQIAAIAGSLGGLLIGGLLSTIDWRLVFLVSVPFGLVGTVWAYIKLHEGATIKTEQKLDLWGNLTFAGGLTILLVGLTYGIQPYGGASFPMRSMQPRGAGPRRPIPTSSITTGWPKADTSRPGNSRNSFQKSFAGASDPCARWTKGNTGTRLCPYCPITLLNSQ